MYKKFFAKDNLLMFLSIAVGTVLGLIVVMLCYRYHLYIFGVNICIFVAPIVAGFVETYMSKYLVNRSSGAISSIILFVATNGIGWLFPQQPLTFNIFTVGGFLLMLQAAFPLLINYLLIGVYFSVIYVLGLAGSGVSSVIHKKRNIHPLKVGNIEYIPKLNVPIFNNCPDVPIKKYNGLIFSESILEFEDKPYDDQLEYMGSRIEGKLLIKSKDYEKSKKYVLYKLQEEAIKIDANAIIDVELEYTNYNQQLPPDIVIAAYGTAVTMDEKYL